MNKKVLTVMTVVMLIVVAISTIAYAVASVTMGLTSNVTSVERGEQVTITFNASDIVDITGGLFGISGKIEYDKNVFETISAETFVFGSGWATPSYNGEGTAAEGKFEISRASTSTSQNTEIFKLSLKVKANATIGSTTIAIKEIKASNSVSGSADPNDIEISLPDKTVAISVKASDVNNIPVVNNNVNRNTTTINNTNSGTINTTSLPKTGAENYILPIVIMLVITVAISYIKYKKAI